MWCGLLPCGEIWVHLTIQRPWNLPINRKRVFSIYETFSREFFGYELWMHIKVCISESLFLFFHTFAMNEYLAYQWWQVESKCWLEREFDKRIKIIMILDFVNFTKWYATYGGEFCLSLHFKNLIGYEALRRNYREGGRIKSKGQFIFGILFTIFFWIYKKLKEIVHTLQSYFGDSFDLQKLSLIWKCVLWMNP